MKRLIYLILPVITLILEIIPYGAVCNFAYLQEDGTIGAKRELFSYFDPLPLGYAHVTPFITALLTSIIFLIVVIYCIYGHIGVAHTLEKWLFICAVVSVCPILMGIENYSFVGLLITLSIFGQWLLIRFTITHKRT
jgi:hypothetical protein